MGERVSIRCVLKSLEIDLEKLDGIVVVEAGRQDS